jgi:hypothetical protein
MVLSLGLGRMITSPQHLRLHSIGWVRGVSSSLGWGKQFGEEFTGMYMKKRNKRYNAHDMMDITFKSIVLALRLSGIEIPKTVLLSSQLPAPVSNSEEEDVHGSEEEDAHDHEEEHAHVSKEDACGREQDHWNADSDEGNQVHSDSRSPMLDTIDKLTEPTACKLLDGTEINVELALAKVFPFQKAFHSVSVQDGYVVVQPTYVWANAGHYPLPVPFDGGDIETLAEDPVQRIQRPKDKILISPMTRHPYPEATTGSRGTTSNGGIVAQCLQEKAQQQ